MRLRPWPIIALFLFGLAACQTARPTHGLYAIGAGAKYVAMGSSFAAGPGIGEPDVAAMQCGRSKSNYAHILAQRMALELVDVTCGGATTQDILSRKQHPTTPPQIEAITEDTKLVTVTIGGNDLNLARDLAITSCNNYSHSPNAPGMLCNPRPIPPSEAQFTTLATNLAQIAQEAKRRAPNARIVFLDYQAILPPTGNCDRIFLKDDEVAAFNARQQRYAQIVRNAAIANNIEFFSAFEATRGHDACAPEPFMAGARSIGNGSWVVPNFHTTQEGMTAIAQGLENYLMQR